MPELPTPAAADDDGHRTYSESVARGFYSRNVGGLFGKYDNVRTYWEDQLTRRALRPHVRDVVRHCAAAGRRVRVLDLGCGAGEGYEVLSRIPEKDLELGMELRYVLPRERLGEYVGIDLSEAMVAQGRENYRGADNVHFVQGDLSEGIRAVGGRRPFDIYFSSYGSLSHLDAATLRACLTDVLRHARAGALVVLDLVGRYSPEWPAYWSRASGMLDYSMSYLYSAEERESRAVDHFTLQFWTGAEVMALCRELAASTGVALHVEHLFDRSVFVGRHVDTGEYGSRLPPLRRVVNRLFELNVRTDLEELRVDPAAMDGPDELGTFLVQLAGGWNALLDFTMARLRGERPDLVELEGWGEFPPQLQIALMNMDRLVDGVGWVKLGDVRANILEPQLAYLLRGLEFSMQRGIGAGHGHLAVLRVGDGT